MRIKSKILTIVSILLMLALAFGLTACKDKNPEGEGGDNPPPKVEVPSAGVYYYSADGIECELNIADGGSFSIVLNGKTESGTSRLNGSVIILDFTTDGKADVEAVYENGGVVLTYEGAVMRMLPKVNYTVKFETSGGSPIADVTVVNGKTVAKPADPTKTGHLFVGWYKDADFKAPFDFASGVVSSNLTIYARWVEATADAREYTVSFNLGYDGASLESRVTLGGRLFGAPTVTRVGYKFCGWWISSTSKADELSYKFTEDYAFTADTTLFAVWIADGSTKLEAPSLAIGENTISWSSVSGARSYDLTVTGSDGVSVFSRSVSSTSVSFSFADYPAGVYRVQVTANSSTGAEDNSSSVITVTNKGLDKPTGLFVSDGSILVFDEVVGAEKYLITVVCGNPNHNHTDLDNGSSKTYNFANCPMTDDGIKFVVKAVAEGYLTSVSDELVYKRNLAQVEGLTWNEEESTVTWGAVANAEYYMVSVLCGNSAHNHGFINGGSANFADLKECAPLSEGILVRVYPVADGYISPAAAEIKVNKSNLKTPSGIVLSGNTLSWEADSAASKYEIKVNGTVYESVTNSFDMSALIVGEVGAKYTVSVRSVGAAASAWSNPMTVVNYAVDGVKYSNNTLSWNSVFGADLYEIQINDGDILQVTGASFAKIALTKSGENTVKVRFVDGSFRSEWASVAVTAYAVIFDSLGGNLVGTQYKAVGDTVELPDAIKTGYTFVSWYNAPGGPLANGKEITELVFGGTEAITLFAHYASRKFEVSYNYGVDGSGLGVKDEVEFGKEFTLEIPTPNEITVSFGGWFSAPYGNGTQYTDGGGRGLAPWSVAENVELYAFWIDETLNYEAVKVNGKDAYAVSSGARISLVSDLTIPAYYNGLPVAMVDGGAFLNCKNLKTVNIPSTVEVISNLDPFAGCTALIAINVYGVDGIGSSRYSSEDGVLFETKSSGALTLFCMPVGKVGSYIIPEGVSEIPESAFAESSLSSVTVPSSVTKIGNDAFLNCRNLVSVLFAESDSTSEELTIGKRAFSGCSALSNILLPSRLTEIELTKYYVNSAGKIVTGTDYAFVGCTSLESVGVADGSATYKVVDGMIYSADQKHLLYCPTAKSGKITVPMGTQSISAGAFIDCDGITEIAIPNTVTYVGEYAFYELALTAVKLERKIISSSELTIGDYAFAECKSLATLTVEPGVRLSVIGEGSFSGCSALTSLSIPATVNTIRDGAFENCSSLSTVSFEANGVSLEFGKNVFANCTSLTTITIPANVSKIPGIFGGCTSLSEVLVDSASPYFTGEAGVIFNSDKTEIIYYPQGKSGRYVIPSGVTTIANGVFRGNTVIEELVIPNTVSYIGEEAFRASKIGKITFEGDTYAESLTIAKSAFQGAYFENYDFTLPSHTKHIGEYAFAEIYFNNQTIVLNEGVETLGDYAFYFPNGTGGGAITIPASVVSIGKYCFSGDSFPGLPDFPCFVGVNFTKENSSLTSIGDFAFYKNPRITSAELPDSVKTIGNYAFYECKNLATLTLPASLQEIGAYAFASASYSNMLMITELTVPEGVRSIGAHAFEHCQLLTSVTFEGTVSSPDLVLGTTYLRSYMKDGVEMFAVERGNVFASCNKLLTVNLSPNITTLGDYCFASAGDAGFAVNIAPESRLATIGSYCFYKSRLTSFTVPATVRNLSPIEEYGVTVDRLGIGEYAFATSTGYLTSITFLKDNNSYPLTIGYFAFENQDKLEALELPARLASYTSASGEVIAPLANGALVFYNATGLTTLTSESGSGAYTVIDGVLYTADIKELVFCPAFLSGKISVPDTVTKIHSYAFMGCQAVTEISFSEQSALVTVGDYSFYGCGISEITLPDGLVSIGEGAFVGCRNLEEVTLSKSLNSIDVLVFDGCPSLKNVFVASTSTAYTSVDGVLYSADKTSLLLYPRGRTDASYTVLGTVITIGQSAFRASAALETVILPSGLREIKDNAFESCLSLKTVVIPNSVELIGDSAFGYNTSLESVVFEVGGVNKLVVGDLAFAGTAISTIQLPARLNIIGTSAFEGSGLSQLTFEPSDSYEIAEIGDRAFAGTNLVSVVFPSGIVSIGCGIFEGSLTIDSVTFGEGLISIGSDSFKESSLREVYFPRSLKTIGSATFYNCKSLVTVVFADGSMLEIIPEGSFFGCVALERIVIPAYVKEIGGSSDFGAFYGCTSLESVSFASGDNCITVGDYAFYGCSKLSAIELPMSVGAIGDYAFAGCTALKEIDIHFTTTSLGVGMLEGCTSLTEVKLNTGATHLPEAAFRGCVGLTYMYIPASVVEIGKDCFEGTSIVTFEVAKENASLVSHSGIIYNAAGTAIIAYPPCHSTETLFIPKGIVEIPDGNFENCTNLKEVIFEEGGTVPLVIGEKAFAYCYQLRRVVLPERLVSIGKYAFRECYNLTSITIPKNVTEIADYAFLWCYKLYEVYNESSIADIGKKGSIKTAQSKVNIYTKDSGASVLFREGDFLFATVDGVKTLIGYEGSDTDVILPSGAYRIAEYLFYYNSSITSVTIPKNSNIAIPVSQAFGHAKNLACIFVEDAAVPSTWDERWHSGKSFVCGYTGESVEYSFVTNGGEDIAPIISSGLITIPTPIREGYVFMGWYANESLSGDIIPVGSYYSATENTLYASWMDETEYERLRYGGKSMGDAFDATEGAAQTIYIDKSGEKIYFKITVSADASYTISITPNATSDAVIYIYDASGAQKAKMDASGNGKTETLTYTFDVDGETAYYIVFDYCNAKHTGTSEVVISKAS